MNVKAKIEYNNKVKEGILNTMPERVLYLIARETLDFADSGLIPMSPPGSKTRGNLKRSSVAAGVRGSKGNYYIGSYTDYASYVWDMPDSTNWSEPGTNNQWYLRALKEHGTTIVNVAVSQARKVIL